VEGRPGIYEFRMDGNRYNVQVFRPLPEGESAPRRRSRENVREEEAHRVREEEEARHVREEEERRRRWNEEEDRIRHLRELMAEEQKNHSVMIMEREERLKEREIMLHNRELKVLKREEELESERKLLNAMVAEMDAKHKKQQEELMNLKANTTEDAGVDQR
jgi:hypothetical protein